MGTREDCRRGDHTIDNQGLCHWCGKLLEPSWWEAYAGEPHPDMETETMAKPLPIPLFKSPESASKIVDGAETLEQACAIEFRDITGRENRLSTRGRDEFPVCCIGRENDYWTLQCNDHDLITDDQRQELASRLRKWEHSRAMR